MANRRFQTTPSIGSKTPLGFTIKLSKAGNPQGEIYLSEWKSRDIRWGDK